MSDIPRVFIGSSTEGLDIAEAFAKQLATKTRPQLWNEGVFRLSDNALQSLTEIAAKFDFAVLVMTPDDIVVTRGEREVEPRDNVIFELGLFMGILGKDRTFFAYPKKSKPRLPSDLLGITAAHYDDPREQPRDADRDAAVEPAAQTILEAIINKGPRSRIHKVADSIRSSVASIERINYTVFREEVDNQSADWGTLIQEWSSGQVYVGERYAKLLLKAYDSAKHDIFSTSVPDYEMIWHAELGEKLLRAQQSNGRAQSTRVFVFQNRTQVTDHHRSLFEKHKRYGVRTLLFIDDDEGVYFPARIGNDFTVIDGGAIIGVTKRVGEQSEATWYFDDVGRQDTFRNLLNQILASAKEV